jgi:hypothetical protein
MVKFSGKDDRAYEMVKEDIEDLIESTNVNESVRTTNS